MGFETAVARSLRSSRTIRLKIPYGIWNADYVSKGNRKDIEFEDSLWDLKLRYQKEFWAYSQFEDSLWDLKLLKEVSRVVDGYQVWRFPMGFETP